MTGRINNKAKDKAHVGLSSSARRRQRQRHHKKQHGSIRSSIMNRINNASLILTSILLLTSGFAYGYSDREILHALFDATGGDDWERGSTTWRDPDSSFCTWEGISCVKDGEKHHVTSISLPKNNLKGEVPMTKLLQLPFLEQLVLGNNDITLPTDIVLQDIDDDNDAAKEIGIVSGLRYLNLDGAHLYDLNGFLGSEETTSVSMTNLTSLILGDCGLHGSFPEEILQLTALEELILDKNDFNGPLPNKLGLMTKLRLLDLSSNHFTGTIPNAIGQLTNLEFLDVNTNDLSGYLTNRINKLTNLKTLNLKNNKFDGPILSLEKLSHLESVDFSKNDFTGYIPTDFLSSVDHEAFAIVNLASNELTGDVPAEPFKKLPPASFWIRDNLITGVEMDLCRSPAAGGYGCNGILCPPGTYNSDGMVNQDSGGCMICLSSKYYGATDCGDEDDDHDVSEEDGGSSEDLSNIIDEDDFQSNEDSSEEGYTESEDESSTDSGENDDDDFDWRDESSDEDESSDSSDEDDLIPSIEEEDKGGQASSDDKSSDESESDDGNVGLLIREVLMSFYEKCGGEAWIENDGWGDDGFVTVCAWKGIHCADNNDQRTVSEIILPDNNIAGSIPEDIFKIPKLTTLNLANNKVAISLANLGDARNLQKLDLSSTGLVSLEGIAAAVNLVELDVSDADIKEAFPDEVTSLRRLERLSLDGNQLTGAIPEKVGNLKRLQYLSLRNNDLRGSIPNIWFSMDALKTLDLSMNGFTGSIPSSLDKCKSLEYLDLSRQGEGPAGGLSGPLNDLIDLVNIEKLDLSYNSLTGTIPATFLEDSKAWRGIFLNANKLSGEVPPLSNGNIDLGDNRITSVALSFCENMDLYDEYGCDAVLCPMGTYNSFGRQTATSGPCKKCAMARFMGSTECASEDGSVEFTSDKNNDDDDDDITIPRMSEREILERFYSATGGENWEESYNWLENDDICAWEGIQCIEDYVIGISLPSNNLNGDVPTSIFSLSQLEILDLKKNDVHFCFEGIGNASSLAVLDLSETFLMHEFDGLDDAANLEELSLAGIGVRQDFPEEILALTKLKKLDLRDNGIKGGIPPFDEQPLLEELYLKNNEFTGSIPDFNLKNLKALTLGENKLTGSIPSSITKRMPKLQRLDLSHNKEIGDPENAPGLIGQIGSLDHLPKLLFLDLSCNSFSGEIPDDFLANVDQKSFDSVDLSDNMLTGEVPNILVGVELDQISLVKNKFTGIDQSFCERSDGSVCDKIMCPPETFERTFGRQTEDNGCRLCPGADNKFWGNTECTKLSTPSPTQSPVVVKPIKPAAAMSEEKILDKLYADCGGPNWRKNTGWEDPSVSHCKRFGVTCSETSLGLVVTSIVLSHNNLIGTPPIELFQLRRLDTLSLSHNDILFDFSDIARAESLKVLGLANTKVIDAKGIGNAKGLEELRMNGNKEIFADLLEMLTLSKLKELIIRGNPDDGPTKTGTTTGPLPTEIGNLTQLRVLSMKGMGITGEIPKEIGNLSYLKLLQLSYNNLSGPIPQELLAISGLADVDLSHQNEGLTGTLPDFAGNKELVYLDLSSNKLTGSIPPTFLETVNPAVVKKLDLSNNKLSGPIDEPIYRIVSEIKSTMVVDLTGNQFKRIKGEACVSEYSCNGIVCDVGTYNDHGRQESADDVCHPCPTAKSLGSTSCTVEAPVQPPTSQPIAKRPTTSQPTVEVLKTEKDILMKFFNKCKGRLWYHRESWGSSNICKYAGVKCAKKQESVEELLLGHNNIQGIPPFELFQLPNLKKLSLYGNTGVTFSFFGIENAKKLEELHLDHTNTRELAGIEKLPDSIKRLSLSNCGFDGHFPTPILNLENLEYLSLGENGFTGTLPRSFSKLVSLSTLIVRNNQFGGNLDGIEFPAYLKMIDLSGNNIDGTIPLTFLSEDRCLKCEYFVDLSHNLLTGKVPSTLARFEMLNIELDNNFFLGIDKEICHRTNWNNGRVRQFGCNALLCPKGSSTQGGKQVSKHHPCKPCPEAEYYGDSRCFLEKSTGWRMKIGTLVFSIGILAVSIVI